MTRHLDNSVLPYTLLSAAFLGCAIFFGFMLWRDAPAPQPRQSLISYTPGFAVQADVVHVMRVVPLAGTSLRSPSVNADNSDAVVMAH